MDNQRKMNRRSVRTKTFTLLNNVHELHHLTPAYIMKHWQVRQQGLSDIQTSSIQPDHRLDLVVEE